ncbi:ATP-binding protein [Streptomyces sp. NPDC093252]|uniref:ATP-binding protein n=1 Tax=Streptomyces sp. NPDC093252 TaxID=3154980 RepID=UPI003414EC1C
MDMRTIEAPRAARWPLKSLAPQTVANVRRDARQRVSAWGYEADDAELVVSELLANVVRHAGGRCVLAVAFRYREILVTCADRCPRPPMLREPDWESRTGRGLQLIANLSVDWGCEPMKGGKRVWVRLAAVPVPPPEVTVREDLSRALRGEAPVRVIERCWFGCGRAHTPGVLTGVASSDFGESQMFACTKCVGRLSTWIREDVVNRDAQGLTAR